MRRRHHRPHIVDPATCTNGICHHGTIQVSLGRGDGTFTSPVVSAFRGFVLRAWDFDGDAKVDIIAVGEVTPGIFNVMLLRGTGTAAVGSAVPVSSFALDEFPFAASADLNGDGKRDLVVPDENGIAVFPGNGNLMFGTPVKLTTGSRPVDVIIADLNADSRRDIVTANEFGGSISVFLNRGSLVFSAMDNSVGGFATDVAAADVNRDGRSDLLVSAGRENELFGGEGFGFLAVLLGRGDGTCQAPATYPVLPGARQVVTADWNKDGIPDAITGNRSSIVHDDCSTPWKTWDSVSILAASI
jgi:FG-GAP-like repeat/FG-GAP repeat